MLCRAVCRHTAACPCPELRAPLPGTAPLCAGDLSEQQQQQGRELERSLAQRRRRSRVVGDETSDGEPSTGSDPQQQQQEQEQEGRPHSGKRQRRQEGEQEQQKGALPGLQNYGPGLYRVIPPLEQAEGIEEEESEVRGR